MVRRGELIGIPWLGIWAFVRISTNARVFKNPATLQKSFATIKLLLDLPNVSIPQPGPRHFDILQRLTIEGQAPGKLVTDAALAAICVEQGAILASTDRDFSRFPGLRWINPIA